MRNVPKACIEWRRNASHIVVGHKWLSLTVVTNPPNNLRSAYCIVCLLNLWKQPYCYSRKDSRVLSLSGCVLKIMHNEWLLKIFSTTRFKHVLNLTDIVKLKLLIVFNVYTPVCRSENRITRILLTYNPIMWYNVKWKIIPVWTY